MKVKQLNSIKLSALKRAITQIEQRIAPEKDCEISFEFIIGSFFPKIMDNIKQEFTRNYLEGYKAAKEEDKVED